MRRLLVGTGIFVGIIAALNLVAFIINMIFMIPFGGMILTLALFGSLIFTTYKAITIWLEEKN